MAKIVGKVIGDIPGTFKEYGGGSVPTYYLLCDGSALNATANPKYLNLFNVIGTTYGGSGVTNFLLPDSRRRVHVGSGGAGTGTLPNTVGSTGGEETHQLSIGELASHTHSDSGHAHTQQHSAFAGGGFNSPISPGGGSSGVVADTLQTQVGVANILSTGSNTPHNNIQPSLVVTKMIKF